MNWWPKSINTSQDQLPIINSLAEKQIQFLNEMRDFVKERAQIERDYAHRLDQLSKRFNRQKERLGSSLMGDPNLSDSQAPISPTSPSATGHAGSERYG
jgi:hypothetical protein